MEQTRIIIFGAGSTGRKIFQNNFVKVPFPCKALGEIYNRYRHIFAEGGHGFSSNNELLNVVAFADSNSQLWGKELFGVPVISPGEIPKWQCDRVIVASISYQGIVGFLHDELSIPYSHIDLSYVSYNVEVRDNWLIAFSQIVYGQQMSGSVAEAGVYEGLFSKKINAVFPDKNIYLFDTFIGFDERDINVEKTEGFSDFNVGHLSLKESFSEIKLLNLLPYPERAIIKKGYFPETAEGIDETFCFVNLDFDLYNPTLSGLRFFYPKLVHGGVILVHDYFSDDYRGVKNAVDEFCQSENVSCVPIGDCISVAIVKR